jgi:quinohemoprotein amine dehydrogenase
MLVFPWLLLGQSEGIPVNDPLVIAKCGSCHTRDERGNMQRLSWERSTPEGWEEALKRMIRLNNVTLTPPEARSILKYLSTYHGLAPEEAKMVKLLAERRTQEEADSPNDKVRGACVSCHAWARASSWRRSPDDWKQLAGLHRALFPQADEALRLARGGGSPADDALAYLAKTAPLNTPEWTAWSARLHAPKLAGRWLVTAYLAGRGQYFGEMEVEPAGADDEFSTVVKLQSVKDGSTITRTGHSVVYADYAWRGRSQGTNPASSAPDDLASEMREVLWIAPDEKQAEGRWFWGPYQEFGFEVKLQRASSDATLLGVDRTALKAGSEANRIRLIGDHFPGQGTPADLNLGPGVTVRRIVSNTSSEIVAEVDVAADAVPGKRSVTLRGSMAAGAIAIYDRVDYIKVIPESALAQFGNRTQPQGYMQFEAIGYQRGPDGQPHTADDVDLGPVDVDWTLEQFHAVLGSKTDFIGKLSNTGFFAPVSDGPNTNYDVWVIATAKNEPLVGKSYLVVSVPSYVLNGRQYVRELGRWVQVGPSPSQ